MTDSLQQSVGEFIAPFALATPAGEISPRRLALLTAIGETGSISAAAKVVGITYKAAWDAVDVMNNLAGDVLVCSKHGGRSGGGANLTEAGHQVVRDLASLRSLQAQLMAQLKAAGNLDTSLALLRKLSMKSSARNILSGTVESIQLGGVNAEVNLRLRGGDTLHAIITRESVQDLELAPGREVQALIKASWIILASASDGLRTSARNRLVGEVLRITPGEINAEVVVQLAGDNTIAAIITQQSLQELGFKVGDSVCALIKASHMILGVQS
ncbi:MAG: TOBE domain-containing protein [Pseudohongiella sp.]|nr:TOBE domain-containing protein [Pseudohongiella sp.]